MEDGEGRDERRRRVRPRTAAKAVSSCDPRKATVYLDKEMLAEMNAEAERQERSLSWVVRRAWKLARAEIRTLAPEGE